MGSWEGKRERRKRAGEKREKGKWRKGGKGVKKTEEQ